MDKLKKQLHANLLKNPAVQIRKEVIWQFPVTIYTVAFNRVKRYKMDILMKMMLLTFEKAQIHRAANLSQLLLVEELFIEDLLKKMHRTGLITLEKGRYRLTSRGREQLNTGIMEEELPEESAVLFYSPIHDEVWLEITEPLTETDEELPLYRYGNHQNILEKDRILHVLAESENGEEEAGFQTVVAAVKSLDQQKVEQVPCLEFQLYDKEQDKFYARVWNTILQRWDETFEKQIEEKERLVWRE